MTKSDLRAMVEEVVEEAMNKRGEAFCRRRNVDSLNEMKKFLADIQEFEAAAVLIEVRRRLERKATDG